MAFLAEHSERPREQALRELAAGHKHGHWIWWAFPTLADRGGDGNSWFTGADLGSVAEAAAYAAHPVLRARLLDVLRAADAAFGRHASLGPYHVLDEAFWGREPQGQWLGGPVDAFKAWASATLFKRLAEKANDTELRDAAAAVLRHYAVADDGSRLVYTAGGFGTAGYVQEEAERRNALVGEDALTVRLLAAADTKE